MGMELFKNKIQSYGSSNNLQNLTQIQYLCGNVKLNGSEFCRLRYCEKNFNDILKSYVILFDLMVVNQWHGILFVTSLLLVVLRIILKNEKVLSSIILIIIDKQNLET